MTGLHDNERLKVLFITAWYPSALSPNSGIFVKEHAKAVSQFNDVVLIYVPSDVATIPRRLYEITENMEDGIRTIRIKYRGILSYLKHLIFRVKPANITTQSEGASKKPSDRLKGLVNILGGIDADLLCCWSVFVAFRNLRKSGWKPDIIHANEFNAGVPAVIIGKLYKVPVLITEHSTAFPTHTLTNYEKCQARFAMNRARMILPVSNDLKSAIESYGINNHFTVVPNVVNTQIFHPLSSRQIRKQGEDPKKILLVAGLHPKKGIPYLLEALAQIKEKRRDFFLDIVGDGPHRQEYEELVKKLDLEEFVRFHGLKPKNEVAQFMQNCDFYVQPSLTENLPCVLIEVMACGKPIVSSNVGGVPEIVNGDRGILVPCADAIRLKDAINEMLDKCVVYSSEIISKYAAEGFNYDAVGKMLYKIYWDVSRPKLESGESK